jgi:hypothetical protein
MFWKSLDAAFQRNSLADAVQHWIRFFFKVEIFIQ